MWSKWLTLWFKRSPATTNFLQVGNELSLMKKTSFGNEIFEGFFVLPEAAGSGPEQGRRCLGFYSHCEESVHPAVNSLSSFYSPLPRHFFWVFFFCKQQLKCKGTMPQFQFLWWIVVLLHSRVAANAKRTSFYSKLFFCFGCHKCKPSGLPAACVSFYIHSKSGLKGSKIAGIILLLLIIIIMVIILLAC